MLRLLAPLVLLFALVSPAEAGDKCKNAYCRWYAAEIDPLYGYGPYQSSFFPDSRFEYAEELSTGTGLLYVQRYMQVQGLSGAGTLPPANGTFRPQSEVYTGFVNEFQRQQRLKGKYAKRARKLWKKGTLAARAMDVIYEFKETDGAPLMRVGIRPLNFDHTAGVRFGNWHSFNLHTKAPDLKAPLGRYNLDRPYTEQFIEMPDLAGIQKGEVRFSEWQFCKTCKHVSPDVLSSVFVNAHKYYVDTGGGLPGLAAPVGTRGLVAYFRTHASLRKGVTIVSGGDAVAAANMHYEAVRLAEERRLAEKKRKEALAARYAEPRKAYEDYVAEVNAGSLAAFRNARCGKLKLYNPPNPRQRGSHAGWFEDNAEHNANAFEKHVNCVIRAIDDYDYTTRAVTLKEASSKLPALFAAANFEDRDMASFYSTRKEVDQQHQYLREQEQRYADLRKDYDRAWREMVEVMAERRERRIEKEVDKCIAGLYATQSLTPNSRSYCRSMAEQGYTGLSAAAAGFRGGSASSSSGSGSVGFTQPLVPEFDLNGMIANAQAVADGADVSLLWNDDGTIRTTIAEEAIAFQQQQERQREREDRERQRRQAPAPVASAPTTASPSVPSVDERIAAAEKQAEQQVVASNATAPAAGQSATTTSDNGNGVNITVAENWTAIRIHEDGSMTAGAAAAPTASNSSGGGPGNAQGGSKVPPANGGSGSVEQPPQPKQPRREPKFVWVGDLEVKNTFWPASSRERAVQDFENVLARNALSEYCRKTHEGSSGHNGVKAVDIIQLEEKKATGTFNGRASLEGYCRILGHHASWDSVKWCVSESSGQPNCAVSQRW